MVRGSRRLLWTAIVAVVLLMVVAGVVWRYVAPHPTESQSTAARISLRGYELLGQSILDGDSGSDPSTNSAGNLYIGPFLHEEVAPLVMGVTATWEAGFSPVSFGDHDMIARGQMANGCVIRVDSLHHDIPSGFLAQASVDEVALFRSAGRRATSGGQHEIQRWPTWQRWSSSWAGGLRLLHGAFRSNGHKP